MHNLQNLSLYVHDITLNHEIKLYILTVDKTTGISNINL